MAQTFLGIGLALCLSLGLTPGVRALALSKGLVDKPGKRKVHVNPVPRLGGLAIFLAVLPPLLLLLPLERATQGFLVGLCILAILGLVDDVNGLDAKAKLPVQLLAAWMMVVFGGTKVLYLELPFIGDWVLPEWGANLFTVLCVMTLTNAMNLIDGLDGLAGGTAALIFSTIALIGASFGNTETTVVTLTFVGAILGFLWYNRYPANIFMGDTGSMILGFGLAYACLKLVFSQPHTISTWVPFGLVALPIFDTVWAFSRRIWQGKSPFSPDKTHIHHRLLRSGIPHPQVVWILYGLTSLLSLQTALLARESGYAIMILTLVTLTLFWLLVRWLQLPPVHATRLRLKKPAN